MVKKRDTKAEKKIVDFLLDHAGEKMYLTQIARASGASVSTAHQILERKVAEDLLKKEKLGNLSQYVLNLNDSFVRQQKVTRVVGLLKPLVEKLQPYSRKIVLFGSAAEGTDSAGSDIDLFILANEKEECQEIVFATKINRKIQAIIKDILEFSELREKDKFFYEEIKKGRVLWEN